MPPTIDLHTHSSASDGTDPPAELVRLAAAAGVDVLAITDHDTTAGWDRAAAALPSGMTLLPGAEFSCVHATPGGRRISLHLLGYLFDEGDPALASELAALRRDRETRARRMVERLQELGVPLEYAEVAAIAGAAPVGRPHIARALAHAGVVARPQEAFTPEWIGSGGRAWIGKRAIDPVHAVALVAAAGGVTVVAHVGAHRRGPVVSDDVVVALARAGLTGLEVDHPDHDEPTRTRLRGFAGELGLVVTGGSDDHGSLTSHRIGCETTSPAAYDELLGAARNPPVSA